MLVARAIQEVLGTSLRHVQTGRLRVPSSSSVGAPASMKPGTLHHLQHRRDQLGLCGQQQAQRDRQRQHPLPHRHMRHDVVDEVLRGLRHSPRTA
jgi:hypothetical protein